METLSSWHAYMIQALLSSQHRIPCKVTGYITADGTIKPPDSRLQSGRDQPTAARTAGCPRRPRGHLRPAPAEAHKTPALLRQASSSRTLSPSSGPPGEGGFLFLLKVTTPRLVLLVLGRWGRPVPTRLQERESRGHNDTSNRLGLLGCGSRVRLTVTQATCRFNLHKAEASGRTTLHFSVCCWEQGVRGVRSLLGTGPATTMVAKVLLCSADAHNSAHLWTANNVGFLAFLRYISVLGTEPRPQLHTSHMLHTAPGT